MYPLRTIFKIRYGGRVWDKVCPQVAQALGEGGGGVLGISSDGDDRKGAKIKTQKNPLGFQQNPKKSLDQKLTRKKSHAEFLTLKILNIKNLRNWMLVFGLFIKSSE